MSHDEMVVNVKKTFADYQKGKDNIVRGFITHDNIQLVRKGLSLDKLNMSELNELWHIVERFFLEKYAVLDIGGDVVSWKPYSEETEFARDSSSAWLEVINAEARERKNKSM